MEEAKAYALSNDDINKILEPDTHIMTYPELRNYKTIDDIFDPLGRVIMLYPIDAPNNGHWVGMWKQGDRINYFDPYGKPPEEPKQWVSSDMNKLMGQGRNLLTDMLKQSGYKVYWNTYPYQKMDEDVATCGRWVVARLVCKDMSADKFYKAVMKYGKGSPDGFAVRFTYDILGK